MEPRKNWKSAQSLNNLTQEQVNQITLRIMELAESMGGYVGGGFIPEEEGDDVQEGQSNPTENGN
jgi:hypothetical protein